MNRIKTKKSIFYLDFLQINMRFKSQMQDLALELKFRITEVQEHSNLSVCCLEIIHKLHFMYLIDCFDRF